MLVGGKIFVVGYGIPLFHFLYPYFGAGKSTFHQNVRVVIPAASVWRRVISSAVFAFYWPPVICNRLGHDGRWL
jgi:hypothetical protein